MSSGRLDSKARDKGQFIANGNSRSQTMVPAGSLRLHSHKPVR